MSIKTNDNQRLNLSRGKIPDNHGHQKWISSVKNSMHQEITGEWNGVQAPKCDRSSGRIQGSEEDSLKVVN